MEGPDCFRGFILTDNEGKVDLRSSVGDHFDINICLTQGCKHTCRDTFGILHPLADDADDGAVGIHLDIGKLLKIARNFIQHRSIIDRHGDADLRTVYTPGS